MTPVGAATIVFVREETPDDPYRRLFEDAGFDVQFFPVLDFRALHEELLAEALARPDAYSGLVLTSERAVRRVLDRSTPLVTPWKSKATYAVGPRTAAILLENSFSLRVPPESDGRRLARAIRAAHDDARPLLFPCSAKRRPELPGLLSDAAIALREIVVYEPVPTLPSIPKPDATPDWVVCFSPSGVSVIANSLRTSWRNARRAAIGQTTAGALDEEGVPAVAVASTPDASGLLAAIRQASV